MVLPVLLLTPVANAAEIKIVTVGALQVALRNIARDYPLAKGDSITVTESGPAALARLIEEDRYDAIFGAAPVLAELEKAGRLVPGTHRPVARSYVGIIVREGTPIPDISTVEAFRTYIRSVRSFAYTDPTTPNGTGAHTFQILMDAGLFDIVASKGHLSDLAGSRDAVARGEYEMAFINLAGATTPGIAVVGPVPASLEQYTHYDMGVFVDGPNRQAAAQFLRFVGSPGATQRFLEANLDHTPN
jgi:molybdate transport system substrate-binding protein